MPKKFRSDDWFGRNDRDGFSHRSWVKNQGFPNHLFDGRPVIGICNTFSELNPCNAHLRKIAEHVKRGVYEAGGFPLEFPVTSLGEALMRPTAMLFRNLASMDVEETIRANPIDGVVLLTGCDKTTPALVMGAASCDLPAIVVSGGPMLTGRWRGEKLGSGTDVWKFADRVRSGSMSFAEFADAEAGMSRSAGHCMTMGTASTMASMVESLGLTLPGNAAIPAVDSRRYVLAHMSGRRIVEMVHENLVMSRILTRDSFANAIMVNGALGGSTNAVIHHLAIAGRVGVDVSLDDWDRIGHDVPCLVDIMPSGRHLMEDFYYAGGVPAVMKELGERLHLDALTVTGQTLDANLATAECLDREVIRTVAEPFREHGGIAVLRGNLCPDGAVIKPSAASPSLMTHQGRAVVFESIEELHGSVDSDDLAIDESCVMVLKHCGPRGYPGMAEVGNMPLPARLLKRGITDMVRISDARMSGTAFGTVVLHVTPEAAIGGLLSLVRTGDTIRLDVPGRQLTLEVAADELDRRRTLFAPPPKAPDVHGGYSQLYVDHVLQANQGADFDFLVGRRGAVVTRESH
jgi:L-arabonate dehydrase